MKIANRTFGHKNFTIKKLLYFGIASGVGAGIITLGTWLFTEKLGLYYLVSTILAGGIAFAIKFVINALWTFNDK